MIISKYVFVCFFIFFLSCTPSIPRYTNNIYENSQTLERAGEEKSALLPEIKKFYKAPYKWGGSTPAGTDCSGLVMTVYKKAYNIALPHNAHQIYSIGTKIKQKELVLGDLVFFTSNGWHATHMGIYIRNGFFVHASSSRGVILDHLSENPYQYQFMGCVRIDTY